MIYPIYVSDQKFENSVDLLLISNENKSHYVYIKDFARYTFSKTKSKNKKYFCKSCLQCFSNKNILAEHKKICLKINGRQAVKLEGSFIEFKNYLKQITNPFNVYVDFECILKSVQCNEGFYTEKYQGHVPCSFSYKLFCVNNKFSKPIVVFRGGNGAYRIIEAILKEYEYCKKVVKKTF